jgi:hypothetical protein
MRSLLQCFITGETACEEGREAGHIHGFKNLSNLHLKVLAFDKNELANCLPYNQPCVAGQKHSPLAI